VLCRFLAVAAHVPAPAQHVLLLLLVLLLLKCCLSSFQLL
jgi:hypothetical protein